MLTKSLERKKKHKFGGEPEIGAKMRQKRQRGHDQFGIHAWWNMQIEVQF